MPGPGPCTYLHIQALNLLIVPWARYMRRQLSRALRSTRLGKVLMGYAVTTSYTMTNPAVAAVPGQVPALRWWLLQQAGCSAAASAEDRVYSKRGSRWMRANSRDVHVPFIVIQILQTKIKELSWSSTWIIQDRSKVNQHRPRITVGFSAAP